MRTARSLLILCTLAATAVGSSAMAQSPEAGSPAPPAGGMEGLNLAKECSSMTGQIGDHCTFTSSNIEAIPVGATAIYYGPVLGPAFISSSVVIDAGDGDTATGYCSVDLSGTPLGMCSFVGGSGSLAGFQGVVTVTVDEAGSWHWDGAYQIGG
jgi:hypothetical protein